MSPRPQDENVPYGYAYFMTVMIDSPLYVCIDCGSLVPYESVRTHNGWHEYLRGMEPVLA